MAIETHRDVLTDHPAVGTSVDDLPTPAPLVDVDILDANIEKMAAFFRGRPAGLRPHAKTHRAPEVARRQVAAGARGVTCAKTAMAEAMVEGGIDDVYIANQVVAPRTIDRVCELARRARVALAVDDASNVRDLSAAAARHGVTLHVTIELDAGMGRCGVVPGRAALELARQVVQSPGLHFDGLHAYEGHVVQDDDYAVRKRETERMLEITMETRDLLVREGVPVEVVTCGGTGTYDISGVYPGVTEHQSGSYVYMDPVYCVKVPGFPISFSVLSTVVSRPTPGRVVNDAGLQVLAADWLVPVAKGHPELVFEGHSEEHGNWAARESEGTSLKVGDRFEVYPGHCCSAANLHDRVYAVRRGVVEAVWLVTARGRSE